MKKIGMNKRTQEFRSSENSELLDSPEDRSDFSWSRGHNPGLKEIL